MPDPLPPSCPVAAAALDELVALYALLDRHLAALGVACKQCGRCCDFARNDYRLYASAIERALVVARHGEPHLAASGRCGFLADGRCTIHPSRPLGCRVHFCDPAHKPREQALYHTWQRRLRALTDRYGIGWGYAPFFAAPGRAQAEESAREPRH